MSMMKRSRQEFELFNDGLASVANYLMLLSQTKSTSPPIDYSRNEPHHNRIFECKTCNRQFASFQALGGHRASHKKPKLSGSSQNGAHSSSENSSISNDNNNNNNNSYSSPPAKAAKKTHECSICGAEFALGQALGGHMRRHRTAAFVEDLPSTTLSLSLAASCRPVKEVKKAAEVVVMRGGGNGSTTLCLDLCL